MQTSTAPPTAAEAALPSNLFTRWLLYGLAALAGGELVFALISGLLDNRGPVGDIGGHLITLTALGATVYFAQRRALGLRGRWVPALVCGLATFLSYALGYQVMGPPMDFLLSLVVLGIATGVTLWLTLRGRIARPALCVAAVGVGYSVGAVAGAAAAVAFGDSVNQVFGGGLTGFMGVVGMIGVIAGVIGSLLSGLALTRVLGGVRSATPASRGTW